MDDLVRHGVEARKDWEAYHSAAEASDPRYHNRPNCLDGSLITDSNIRPGTAYRPLCEWCRNAQKPSA